jgi:hypothetical protein
MYSKDASAGVSPVMMDMIEKFISGLASKDEKDKAAILTKSGYPRFADSEPIVPKEDEMPKLVPSTEAEEDSDGEDPMKQPLKEDKNAKPRESNQLASMMSGILDMLNKPETQQALGNMFNNLNKPKSEQVAPSAEQSGLED